LSDPGEQYRNVRSYRYWICELRRADCQIELRLRLQLTLNSTDQTLCPRIDEVTVSSFLVHLGILLRLLISLDHVQRLTLASFAGDRRVPSG
jgi:hypothetical protein